MKTSNQWGLSQKWKTGAKWGRRERCQGSLKPRSWITWRLPHTCPVVAAGCPVGTLVSCHEGPLYRLTSWDSLAPSKHSAWLPQSEHLLKSELSRSCVLFIISGHIIFICPITDNDHFTQYSGVYKVLHYVVSLFIFVIIFWEEAFCNYVNFPFVTGLYIYQLLINVNMDSWIYAF